MARQPTSGGKIEAMSDVLYDIVTELSNCGRAVDALDEYLDDAKKANDREVLDVFEQIRQDSMRHCDMLRGLIANRVNQGMF